MKAQLDIFDTLCAPPATPPLWPPCTIASDGHGGGLVSADGLVRIRYAANTTGSAEQRLATVLHRIKTLTLRDGHGHVHDDQGQPFLTVSGNFVEYSGAFRVDLARGSMHAASLPPRLFAAAHRRIRRQRA